MKYSLAILFLFLTGCAPSVIKLDIKKNLNSYEQFGKTPGRDFIMQNSVSDSLILKWEAAINGSFPNSSITAYDNYIFINDLSGRIYCYDITSGKMTGLLRYSGAVYTTPVIDNTTVVFAVAQSDKSLSRLYYYDFNSGKVLFEEEIKGRILTEIIKDKDAIIFNTENGKVFKYSLLGDMLWEYDTDSRVHSSPALGNNTVVFGNDDGEIIAINSESGNLLYREKIGTSFFGGVSIRNGTAFIGNDEGIIYAINISDGNVIWQYQTGSRIVMVPAADDKYIFVGNLKGELFKIENNSGTIVWKTDTKGVLNASPLITKNIILLPDLDRKFHFVNPGSGKIIKSFDLEGRGKLSPVIYNDILFIGYDNGIIQAYEFYN